MKFVCLLTSLLAGLLLCAEVALPPLSGRVVDQANVFSPEGKKKLTSSIQALEQASGGQMAVVTIPTLDDTPIEDFGIRLAEKWKIGQKGKDNGAILIIVPQDRSMRLEVGYGWEGPINDAKAGDVIRSMAPFFRTGNFDDGARYAVAKVHEYVTGKMPEDAPPIPEEKSDDLPMPLIILIIVVVIVIIRSGGGGFFFLGGGGGGRGGFGGGGSFGGGGGSFGGGGASGKW